MFSNYRYEISEKVKVLEATYNKIDKYFHEYFSLRGAEYGIVSGKYYYEAIPYALSVIMDWSKDFEDTMTEIQILQSKHRGGFFDGEKAIAQDRYNTERIKQLSENHNKIMKLVRESKIKEM